MHTNAVSLLSGLACARCSVPPAGGGGGEEEEEEELPMTRTVLVFVATAISFNAVDVAVDEDVVVVVVVVTVSVAAVLVAVLTFALPFVNMAGNEEVEREAKNEGIAVVVGVTLLLLLEHLRCGTVRRYIDTSHQDASHYLIYKKCLIMGNIFLKLVFP